MKAFFVAIFFGGVGFGLFFLIRADERIPRVSVPATQTSSRFTLVEQGSVYDPDAYNRKRTIYILTDTQTGTSYVGGSGIGISEMGTGVKPALEADR